MAKIIRLSQAPKCSLLAGAAYSQIPGALLKRMVSLLNQLHVAVNTEHQFGGLGGPWEFNLRDLLRWCQLMQSALPMDSRQVSLPPFKSLISATLPAVWGKHHRALHPENMGASVEGDLGLAAWLVQSRSLHSFLRERFPSHPVCWYCTALPRIGRIDTSRAHCHTLVSMYRHSLKRRLPQTD